MKYDFYITGTIGEEFDWWTGQRGTTSDMVKDFLDRHEGQEVNIAVSSPGGYLNEGITIAEMIAAHGKCNMVIVGMTASSATVLCMKAKSVKIARGSLMLIHNSSQYILGQGLSNKRKLDAFIERLKATRQELDTIDKAIADFYTVRNGKSIEDNMAMMGKEKWMTAQEAVDFGIVDGILDDDDSVAQTKAIQNVYASYNDIEKHYYLPALPKFEQPTAKLPKGIMAKLKEFFNDFRGVIEEDTTANDVQTNPIPNMNKTFIKVNALLKVDGLNESADGVVLTTAQLQVIEDHLAELQGKVENLAGIEAQLAQAKTDKQTADTAKAAAEQQLADLQQEFDNFKAEAGGDTPLKPSNDGGKAEPVTAKNMYNSIKNLL